MRSKPSHRSESPSLFSTGRRSTITKAGPSKEDDARVDRDRIRNRVRRNRSAERGPARGASDRRGTDRHSPRRRRRGGRGPEPMIATRSWVNLREISARQTSSTAAKVVAIASAGAYGAAIVASDGQPLLVVVPVAAIISTVIFARPVLGMYLILSAGLLFEQWGVEGLDPLTAQSHFFENIAGFTSIELRLSMSDLLVLITLGGAFLNQVNGVRRWRAGPLGLAVAAYGATFLLGMGIGVARGAEWSEGAALAELRGPVYLCAAYFLATNLVRTRGDL